MNDKRLGHREISSNDNDQVSNMQLCSIAAITNGEKIIIMLKTAISFQSEDSHRTCSYYAFQEIPDMNCVEFLGACNNYTRPTRLSFLLVLHKSETLDLI